MILRQLCPVQGRLNCMTVAGDLTRVALTSNADKFAKYTRIPGELVWLRTRFVWRGLSCCSHAKMGGATLCFLLR